MVAVDNSRIINGNQTLRSKERISTKTPGGHSNIEKPKILKLATINIQHAGNSKLEQATRCLREMKIDIAVLTETKLPIYHTTNCEGYHITVSEAVSNSQGGVALCVRTSRYFLVEGTKTYGNNVISTQLVSGGEKMASNRRIYTTK